MPTTIERLKNGECLCPKCGEINQPGYRIHRQHNAHDYLGCINNCEHDAGASVQVITWEDVKEDFPHFSHADHAWLAKGHPELKAEA